MKELRTRDDLKRIFIRIYNVNEFINEFSKPELLELIHFAIGEGVGQPEIDTPYSNLLQPPFFASHEYVLKDVFNKLVIELNIKYQNYQLKHNILKSHYFKRAMYYLIWKKINPETLIETWTNHLNNGVIKEMMPKGVEKPERYINLEEYKVKEIIRFIKAEYLDGSSMIINIKTKEILFQILKVHIQKEQHDLLNIFLEGGQLRERIKVNLYAKEFGKIIVNQLYPKDDEKKVNKPKVDMKFILSRNFLFNGVEVTEYAFDVPFKENGQQDEKIPTSTQKRKNNTGTEF